MSETEKPMLETKDVRVDPDVASAFSDFMGAFEAFRETNEERLVQIERRMAADVVTTDKLDRLNAALDDYKARVDAIVLKNARPAIHGGEAASSHLVREHKAAFGAYVRGGHETGLKDLERKALTEGAADGGFMIPPEIEAEVSMRLAAISSIRSISSVQPISSGIYKKPVTSEGPAAAWATGSSSFDETAGPTLHNLTIEAHELYAVPAASQVLLEDGAVDVDRWLAAEIELAFAEKENEAFVNGSGNSQPDGFMAASKIAEASWSWDKLGFVATGDANGFKSSSSSVSSADALIDLVYALKAAYRQNGTFVMNRRTQAEVRKLKDADGNHVWAPPASPGAPASLLNFPVVESEEMDEVSAGKYPIAFGDFRRGYLIVDRAGIRILRDPYSAKPNVLFYTTKRVGGAIQDYAAIKLLKVAG